MSGVSWGGFGVLGCCSEFFGVLFGVFGLSVVFLRWVCDLLRWIWVVKMDLEFLGVLLGDSKVGLGFFGMLFGILG